MSNSEDIAKPALAKTAQLPAAAKRALAEAEERRKRTEAAQSSADNKASADTNGSGEKGGPKGKEPTRYGDWERNGRAIDF